jgi:hypothetical protein
MVSSVRMRIEGETPGQTLREAWVALTPSEARELRDALDDLLEGVGSDWHAHVTSEDGMVELIVGPQPAA